MKFLQLSTLKHVVKRTWILLLVAAAILLPDSGSFVVLYALGVTLLVSVTSHWVRKILFPYVDMRIMSEKAGETPIGSAIVFASISVMLSTIIFATCMLLK